MLFLRSRLYASHLASLTTVSNRVQRVQLGRRHSLARMGGHHGISSHFLRRFGRTRRRHWRRGHGIQCWRRRTRRTRHKGSGHRRRRHHARSRRWRGNSVVHGRTILRLHGHKRSGTSGKGRLHRSRCRTGQWLLRSGRSRSFLQDESARGIAHASGMDSRALLRTMVQYSS